MSTDDKSSPEHVESLGKIDVVSSEPTSWTNLREEANFATQAEHELTFWQGLKTYPKACAWSALVSLCIIMDGYDRPIFLHLRSCGGSGRSMP
jgi:hypothetical protein